MGLEIWLETDQPCTKFVPHVLFSNHTVGNVKSWRISFEKLTFLSVFLLRVESSNNTRVHSLVANISYIGLALAALGEHVWSFPALLQVFFFCFCFVLFCFLSPPWPLQAFVFGIPCHNSYDFTINGKGGSKLESCLQQVFSPN